MRKITGILSVLFAAMLGLSACAAAQDNTTVQAKSVETALDVQESATADTAAEGTATENAEDPVHMSIVTTIFPEYDWVMNILGDKSENAEVTMLLDNGVDLHSYQPTAMDIAKIAGCDLFIYVGGESDEWVEDALAESTNPDMKVINLLEVLGDSVKEEEIKEGMEHNHDHDHEDGDEHDHEDGDEHDHEDGDEHDHEEGEEHDHEEGEDHDHDHEEPEYDEHVWLSLRFASVICEKIADTVAEIDSANAESYKNNAESYISELNALDSEYTEAIGSASCKTLLFGDRFPFRYLTDDYGLDYYAAFVGCSAESEASFETIIFLSGKVDELDLKNVMKIESSDGKIAQTIIDNTESKDQQILTLDSMQSTTSKDVQSGSSYLSIMKSNLEVLKTALN